MTSGNPGLLRAREPFRFRNALTGAVILSFVTGVYFYSISAVKQDDFSDVPLPSPEDMRRIQAEIEAEKAQNAADGKARLGGSGPGRTAAGGAGANPLTTPEGAHLPAMGILGSVAFLGGRAESPSSDPTTPSVPPARGFVQGAPPLDRLGTTKDRTTLASSDRRLV